MAVSIFNLAAVAMEQGLVEPFFQGADLRTDGSRRHVERLGIGSQHKIAGI